MWVVYKQGKYIARYLIERELLIQLKSFDDITCKHQPIYISPHLDDVAYSCGGNIALQVSQGQHPLVITVFAGLPSFKLRFYSFAFRIHKGMGFGMNFSRHANAIMALRRKEDTDMFDYLHADYLWLDYLDAVYRGKPAHYTKLQQLLSGVIHPQDLDTVKQLAQDLVTLHKHVPEATWYAPLGVGHHVDHLVIFAAVGALIEQGANVTFYEDFPYVVEKGVLHERLQELDRALEPTLVDISEMLSLRKGVATLYPSQIKMNFGTKEAIHKEIERYVYSICPQKNLAFERYWHIKQGMSQTPKL